MFKMGVEFEVTDKTGKRIHLSKERWKHILANHPYMFDQLDNIQITLKRPLTIRFDEFDENLRYYFKYFKERKSENYLLVAVKYLNNKCFVITSFYTDKIKGLK